MIESKICLGESVHISYETAGVGRYDHLLREKVLSGIIRSTFSKRNPSQVKILDMGCGRGELLKALSTMGFDVVGVDVDPTCVRLAGSHARTFHGGYDQAKDLFAPGTFDMVVSSHSLEHLENPKRDLKSLVQVSREYVLVAVPNPLALPNLIYCGILRKVQGVNLGHHYAWDHRHLKNFLENHVHLEVRSWHGDFLRLFPRKMGIRRGLMKTAAAESVEQALSNMFPFLCNSIIALCKKKGTPA